MHTIICNDQLSPFALTMAQTPQSPKQKWKVGSFFQQAVAGVESKLDLILAEEEDKKQLEQLQAKSNPAQANQTSSTVPPTLI